MLTGKLSELSKLSGVQASVLVQRAERAIAKANPPKSPPGRSVAQDDGSIDPSTLRNMRAVHSKLTDDQFEAQLSLPVSRIPSQRTDNKTQPKTRIKKPG